ncbi:MAG TPA: alpha/beta hydrolase [Steroidobacteraceae bacterium]|jgi:pimeloyl-ACP methyl ester carboxylesterase
MQLAIKSGDAALTLEIEQFGDGANGTILLIMGLGTQLIAWPMELCNALVARGYRVVRYDNRDVGLSSKFADRGVPSPVSATLRALLRLKIDAPYDLEDMARDAVGLMDALNIDAAHIVGASMGGMIGQLLAAKHASRVRSLAAIMSSPGAPLPWDSTAAARRALMKRPSRGASKEELIKLRIDTYRVIGGPRQSVPEVVLREMAQLSVERSVDSAGSQRQLVATQKTGSLKRLLRDIRAPTVIIHGSDDPLIPLKRGEQLHRGIAGSRLVILQGMGHNLPRPMLPAIAEAICSNCARAVRA